MPSTPWIRICSGDGGTSTRCNVRLSRQVAGPQFVASACGHVWTTDQSFQAQYRGCLQSPVQPAVSNDMPAVHGDPHQLGCLAMARLRVFCPWHPPWHTLQSAQSPHWQSQQVGSSHASSSHDDVMLIVPLHGAPLPIGYVFMSRVFVFWPVPQVTGHSDQSLHSPNAQSISD